MYKAEVWQTLCKKQLMMVWTLFDSITDSDHCSIDCCWSLSCILTADPANIRLRNNVIFYKDIMSENERNGVITPTELKNTRSVDEYRATDEFFTYEALCRGDTEVTVVSRELSYASTDENLHCQSVSPKTLWTPYLKNQWKDFT